MRWTRSFAVALLVLIPGSLAAQQALASFEVPAGALAPAGVQASAPHKEPIVAGVLSWILPGLGSFYAGNSGHGVRHLVIEGVGFGVFIAGAAQSTTDVFTGESSGGEGLIATGLVVLVVNGVWSIVAAVTDANGYNRRAAGGGRNDGALQFRPAVRVLSGNSASLGPSMPRAGLEVVRLSF